jgi:hypothetical protein
MRRLLLLIAMLFALPAFAAHEPMSDPPVRVGIVMFDGVQIIDFAGPYEVFGNAGFGVVAPAPPSSCTPMSNWPSSC